MRITDNKINSLHLIETLTGKTIARGSSPAQFRQVINQNEADQYTVHDEHRGWFAPATIIFNKGQKHE